jgi:glycosyltransferase involved in cell wall biosynthesis
MNAADPKLFPPRDKEPPIEPGLPIRVVYHGTLLHRYGVDLGLRAFALARKSEPRLQMVVLGDGDLLPELRRLAAELSLGPDALDLAGQRLPLDEVARRIRDAHIGLIPNRDDQEDSVLPTKLLEYVSIGIPAVATKTRCVSQFFDHRQLELVPVGDVEGIAQGILRVATDSKRRKEMIAAAREWNEEYGFDVQKRLLFRTIDALCWEKVSANKRAKQANIDGVKTGPKPVPKPKEHKSAGHAPAKANESKPQQPKKQKQAQKAAPPVGPEAKGASESNGPLN